MSESLKFSISNIQEVATESSDEFSYAKIAVLSTRPNSHKVKITEEILKRDGISILGKWVVCDFNGFDATTHTPQEHIVGIVPKDANVEFVKDEDGYVTMFVDAIISKLYAKEVYNMFKKDNFRNVSVEMMTSNDFTLPSGEIEIDGLKIFGITILGKTVNGSCPNANMSITQFSADKAEEYYEKNFAKNEAMRLANDLMNFAKNLSNKEFSKEDFLDKEEQDKEETMEKEKMLSVSAETDKEKDVVMEEVEAKEDKAVEMETVEEKEEKDSTEEKDMAEIECAETETKDNEDKEIEKTEEEKDMSCDEEKDMSCDGDKEMSEDSKEFSEDKTEDVEEKEKSMSEIAVEFAETEEDKEFIEKMFSSEIQTMVKEIIELKKFQDSRIAQDKINRLNAIMANVKEDLDAKQFTELQAEGETLGFAELDAFENKVKAFAYETSKLNRATQNKINEEEILTFANSEIECAQAEMSADDIFNKYL